MIVRTKTKIKCRLKRHLVVKNSGISRLDCKYVNILVCDEILSAQIMVRQNGQPSPENPKGMKLGKKDAKKKEGPCC